ncbi:hypothetical protein EKO27_g1045 [Xylaria grammica]|uniref:Rhodopsin domain-containing protein n=1 Tax=Xylaria grammica TaxID=363999 RepID=A0A439DI47_9PEZI|nr:hypothetical protein EKO27_g1045 [Xylaria grammica]
MNGYQSTALGDDERHEVALSYGTIIGTGALNLLICGGRLFTRAFVTKTFGIDDWACLVALAFTTTFNIIGLVIITVGSGRHVTHVSTPELTLWFKLYYTCTALSVFIALVVKTSLILCLRRLFPQTYIEKWTPAFLGAMVVITISFVFVDVFQCNPPKYVYELQFVMAPDRAKHCLPPNTVYNVFLFQAILFFTIDIIILLMPAPVVWSLNIRQRHKGLIVLLISVPAIIACIAPTLRFQSLDFLKSQDTDITFHSASALYWQAIEYNLGMIAGSIGSLKPLFIRLGAIGRVYLAKAKLSSSYKLEESAHDDSLPKKSSAFRVQGDSVLNDTVYNEDEWDPNRPSARYRSLAPR